MACGRRCSPERPDFETRNVPTPFSPFLLDFRVSRPGFRPPAAVAERPSRGLVSAAWTLLDSKLPDAGAKRDPGQAPGIQAGPDRPWPAKLRPGGRISRVERFVDQAQRSPGRGGSLVPQNDSSCVVTPNPGSVTRNPKSVTLNPSFVMSDKVSRTSRY